MSAPMVPDEAVFECTACGTGFGVFIRKHHCQNCGNVFCDKCTHGRTALTIEEDAPLVRVCDQCMVDVAQRLSNAKEELAKKLQDFERGYEEDRTEFNLSLMQFEAEIKKFESERSDFEEQEKLFFTHEKQFVDRQSHFLSYGQYMTIARQTLYSQIRAKFEVRREFESPHPYELLNISREVLEVHESQFEAYKSDYLDYEKKFLKYKKCFEKEKKIYRQLMGVYQQIRSMDLNSEEWTACLLQRCSLFWIAVVSFFTLPHV